MMRMGAPFIFYLLKWLPWLEIGVCVLYFIVLHQGPRVFGRVWEAEHLWPWLCGEQGCQALHRCWLHLMGPGHCPIALYRTSHACYQSPVTPGNPSPITLPEPWLSPSSSSSIRPIVKFSYSPFHWYPNHQKTNIWKINKQHQKVQLMRDHSDYVSRALHAPLDLVPRTNAQRTPVMVSIMQQFKNNHLAKVAVSWIAETANRT